MACSTTLLCHLTIPVTITATCDLAASASNCHRRRVFGVPPVTALTHSNASKRAGVEWERSVHRILLGECPHCGADVIAPQCQSISRIVVFGISGPARPADLSLKKRSAFLRVSVQVQIRFSTSVPRPARCPD
jgi:hypothetical protein